MSTTPTPAAAAPPLSPPPAYSARAARQRRRLRSRVQRMSQLAEQRGGASGGGASTYLPLVVETVDTHTHTLTFPRLASGRNSMVAAMLVEIGHSALRRLSELLSRRREGDTTPAVVDLILELKALCNVPEPGDSVLQFTEQDIDDLLEAGVVMDPASDLPMQVLPDLDDLLRDDTRLKEDDARDHVPAHLLVELPAQAHLNGSMFDSIRPCAIEKVRLHPDTLVEVREMMTEHEQDDSEDWQSSSEPVNVADEMLRITNLLSDDRVENKDDLPVLVLRAEQAVSLVRRD